MESELSVHMLGRALIIAVAFDAAQCRGDLMPHIPIFRLAHIQTNTHIHLFCINHIVCGSECNDLCKFHILCGALCLRPPPRPSSAKESVSGAFAEIAISSAQTHKHTTHCGTGCGLRRRPARPPAGILIRCLTQASRSLQSRPSSS